MAAGKDAREEIRMSAVAYFSRAKSEDTVPVVCPACGTAYPVSIGVLRRARTLGCPSCRHVRATPALPFSVGPEESRASVSEFPRASRG